LENLARSLETIGAICAREISVYQSEIEERLSELERSNEDDDRPAQRWQGTLGEPMSEWMQAIEVGHLFDGLR
jgi:hypothetical protein